jgi:hypothetical protein
LWILEPAIVLQYATTGQIGAAFKFGDMFRFISSNLGDYAMAVIIPFIVPLIVVIPFACISGILGIIPIIGIIFSIVFSIVQAVLMFTLSFYLEMLRAHLYGQLLRASQSQVATTG